MTNLFEILRQAQSGTALPSFGRQFGLDPAQTQRAVEALLPAFSLAFRRNAQDPGAFAGMLQLMTSGRYAPFFDGSGGAFAMPGVPGGQDVLTALFGREEASRQVAAQAAAVTGLGVQTLQDMMPALGATLIGGLFRYASIEGFADLLRQWSDALRTAAAPAARPAQALPWSGWLDLIGTMTGAAPPPPPPRPAPTPPFDPFAAWAALMGGPSAPNPPPASAPPSPPGPNPFASLAAMYETGRDVQAQHLAALQGILDGAWGARRPG